jgi:ATP-dependent Clp protease ATP-binding subunit ClpC
VTDGEGRTVDFSNVVLVMTSNLGAGRAKRALGFTAEATAVWTASACWRRPSAPSCRSSSTASTRSSRSGAHARAGRADRQPHVARVAERLITEHGIELEATDALVARLARDGFDEEYGARPLQRHVRRTLEKELTRAILDGRLGDGAHVVAGVDDEGRVALSVSERQPAVQAVAA